MLILAGYDFEHPLANPHGRRDNALKAAGRGSRAH
jgi:hypothetical protein